MCIGRFVMNLENDLIGKSVMSKQGFLVGIIKDASKDDQTHELKNILVKPSRGFNSKLYDLNKQGEIVFPSGCVSRVKNVVILEDTL